MSFVKLSRRIMFLIVAMGLGLSAGLITQAQNDEPNVGILFLIDGETVENTFSGAITSHLYGFNGTAGDVVSISMIEELGSDLDPFLVLLGARGEVIASDDDGGEGLSSSVEDITLPADGTYFVLATSFVYIDTILAESDTLTEDQAYTLNITGFSKPVNTSSEVDEVDTLIYFSNRLNDGETLDGTSTSVEPVYYYRFLANAGDIVDIELTSADFDTMLYVFGKDGARLAVNDDDPDGVGTNSAIRGLEITEDGKFLIFATQFAFYNANSEDEALAYSGGDFKISLKIAR